MSAKRNFYHDTCFLARADPEAVTHLVAECRQTYEDCKAKAWHELTEIQIADRLLIADMMCDPRAGHCYIESDGLIRNVNDVTAAAFQRSKAGLVGTNIKSYFSPHVAAYRLELAQRVIETGQPQRFTDRTRTGRPVESITVPMTNGCLMVLFRPIPQDRVFGEAFGLRGGGETQGMKAR